MCKKPHTSLPYSLTFLQASLSALGNDLHEAGHDYSILRQSSICYTGGQFDEEKFQLLLKKNFFPYEYA